MNVLEFIRQFRLGGYAIFDLVVSFIGIYLLAPRLSKWCKKINLDVPRLNWVFLTLPIGLIFHFIFSAKTQMFKDFIDLNGHYVLKLIILASLILGLRNIKLIKNQETLAKK
ncbi:MAG: hypothetical protein ACOYL8_01080 [Patescibacteria group bacterium]